MKIFFIDKRERKKKSIIRKARLKIKSKDIYTAKYIFTGGYTGS